MFFLKKKNPPLQKKFKKVYWLHIFPTSRKGCSQNVENMFKEQFFKWRQFCSNSLIIQVFRETENLFNYFWKMKQAANGPCRRRPLDSMYLKGRAFDWYFEKFFGFPYWSLIRWLCWLVIISAFLSWPLFSWVYKKSIIHSRRRHGEENQK